MRKAVLTATILFGLTSTAHAQIPVTDLGLIAQQVKDYGQHILDYARQGQQLVQEIQMVQQEVALLNSFVQTPSLGGAMGLMQQAGLNSELPINPYAVQGLLQGHGGIPGALGQIGSLANGSLSSNSFWKPTDSSWMSQEEIARANSNAGAQGIGMKLMQDMASRAPILDALRTKLLASTTPKEVMDAQAQLQVEQAYISNSATQLQAANMTYIAQKNAEDTRQNEHLDKSVQSYIQKTKAAGDY